MLRLRHTLLAIYKTVREECGLAALDENLWAFWGFYHAPDDRHYQVRQSKPRRPGTIRIGRMIATPQEADAVRLIISREAAEWNSSSTYLVMAVHATGELHELIGNVARDEIKHLAILSAADRYLFGPRTWRRFRDLVRNSLDEYGGHKRKRSGGELRGTSWVTALEVVVGHLLVEVRVRTWLRSLPLITLSSVFETSSSALSVAQQKGYERRAHLDRWKLRLKRRTEELQAWEREHVNAIEDVIATKLRGFAEAEEPDSPGDRMVRRQIRWLRPKMLRQSLLDRLRDYQVRNNCYVRAHQPPVS